MAGPARTNTTQTYGGTLPTVTPTEPQPAQQPVAGNTTPEVPVTTQTKPGDIAEPLETTPTATNAGDDGGLWEGFPQNRNVPNGKAYGWWKNHQEGHPRYESPIFTPAFQRTETDPDYRVNTNEDRNSDDYESYNTNRNYNANRANLRRGIIRDYLLQNLRNTILETKVSTNDRNGLQLLTRAVADQLSRTISDPLMVTNNGLKTIEREIANFLRTDSIHASNQLSVPVSYDRAIQISQLLLKHLPHDVSKQFKDVTPQKMLDGMILLQLWEGTGGCLGDVRKITNCKPSILPDGMVWASFRDAGVLVAALLKNAQEFNDNRSIDMAVQRFVKVLLAKGELGVLLTAVKLTADARSGQMSLSRVAALVQVYELIGQLVRNAEQAMKEAAASAAPKQAELSRTDRGLAFSGAVESDEAEAALRQYLAFNPAAQADSGASAFFSEGLAETSARIAVDSSQREIVEWLSSGRHRFVTEVDIGRPVGVVIDRSSDECLTASQIRIVLVRDASVLGWHILRSSLVG